MNPNSNLIFAALAKNKKQNEEKAKLDEENINSFSKFLVDKAKANHITDKQELYSSVSGIINAFIEVTSEWFEVGFTSWDGQLYLVRVMKLTLDPKYKKWCKKRFNQDIFTKSLMLYNEFIHKSIIKYVDFDSFKKIKYK